LVNGEAMADDEFDFSDDDLDDLPTNTLQHLEASAIRATQHQATAAPDSDYGLDDGDEVINLDEAPGPRHASPWATGNGNGNGNAPQYTQPQQDYDNNYDDTYDHDHHVDVQLHTNQMEVDEPPRRSQADPNQLLQRIKKVRWTLRIWKLR
jgi:hypothetical protein